VSRHGGGFRRVLPVLAVVAVILGGSLAATSAASFNAQAANPGNIYAFTALYAASTLTATPSGHDVNLGWAAGTNGNGYAVLGVNNGASNDCSGASFASIGSTSGTSYTDSGRSTPQGTWFCYQVKTSYGPWTSVNSNPTAAAQLGVVATSVLAGNGGTAGTLDTGDTITVTFNQAIATATGPGGTNTVCSDTVGTIMLGSTTTAGGCSTAEAVNLGTLTGGTANHKARWSANYAWSAGNTKLTITLGALTNGTNPTVSGTWTLNPSTTASRLLSATGSFHTCDTNTGGGNCLPALTGGF
jgi:hypothetical protein